LPKEVPWRGSIVYVSMNEEKNNSPEGGNGGDRVHRRLKMTCSPFISWPGLAHMVDDLEIPSGPKNSCCIFCILTP